MDSFIFHPDDPRKSRNSTDTNCKNNNNDIRLIAYTQNKHIGMDAKNQQLNIYDTDILDIATPQEIL